MRETLLLRELFTVLNLTLLLLLNTLLTVVRRTLPVCPPLTLLPIGLTLSRLVLLPILLLLLGLSVLSALLIGLILSSLVLLPILLLLLVSLSRLLALLLGLLLSSLPLPSLLLLGFALLFALLLFLLILILPVSRYACSRQQHPADCENHNHPAQCIDIHLKLLFLTIASLHKDDSPRLGAKAPRGLSAPVQLARKKATRISTIGQTS
ncbi:MAG TPA: hypothetical protein VLM38_05285 [Blastocatellia bacterium]|nr:hypothetical protein [Blastocatellia bacterium]